MEPTTRKTSLENAVDTLTKEFEAAVRSRDALYVAFTTAHSASQEAENHLNTVRTALEAVRKIKP